MRPMYRDTVVDDIPNEQLAAESEQDLTFRTFACLSMREKATLAAGKVRRFVLGTVRKDYVRQQEQKREGECQRCGACCRILVECPFLVEGEPGTFSCRIHGKKPDNCDIFPVNVEDLHDRDIVAPMQSCGFRFRGD
jgi:hypothetical protein